MLSDFEEKVNICIEMWWESVFTRNLSPQTPSIATKPIIGCNMQSGNVCTLQHAAIYTRILIHRMCQTTTQRHLGSPIAARLSALTEFRPQFEFCMTFKNIAAVDLL